MDIDGWLRGIGLDAVCARCSATTTIDVELLGELTNEHLKDFGVVSLRPSQEAAGSDCGAGAGASLPCRRSLHRLSRRPKTAAERRQVTVMFSDLVGSTALSARMDPEDLREVISAYQKCVAETVQRFGGFVAKYMGDGVLVYFGYPQAHEDDAERAVRAGLELIAAVGGAEDPALHCKPASALPPGWSSSAI